jgi:ABC-type transport system involved in cytochrome c biogenesis permease subunit
MGESSILWLRVAACLYFVGLIDAIATILRRRETFFRLSAGTFGLGALFHLVSLVEQGLATNHFPTSDILENLSFCGLIVAAAFVAIRWRYKDEAASLSVFIFPLVFLMTFMAALRSPISSSPVPSWSSDTIRGTWLVVHIVAELIGYAALLFTSIGSVLYLIQERQLKRKVVPSIYRVLPALGTLDDLILKSLSAGFVFITAGLIIAIVWAFIEHGTRWIGNSSITFSFVTWGVYLALVFFRVSAGWRGRKAAILSLVALAFCAITLAAHAGLQNRLL